MSTNGWAMAENCSVLDSWTHRFFARENDAVTRALQASLLSNSSPAVAAEVVPSPESFSGSTSSLHLHPSAGFPTRGRESPAGRVSKKRKSRASKRSPTTYITADPANFRELVQRVTGTRPGDVMETTPDPALPPPPAAGAVAQGNRLRPALDAAGLLLDQTRFLGPEVVAPGFAEFDPLFLLPNFPTLDSWGAM